MRKINRQWGFTINHDMQLAIVVAGAPRICQSSGTGKQANFRSSEAGKQQQIRRQGQMGLAFRSPASEFWVLGSFCHPTGQESLSHPINGFYLCIYFFQMLQLTLLTSLKAYVEN
ncbi:hypothetical protein NE237_005001 [Protea cynaroides]|uniref:Uncharacterized protein n=1 Tax=Protea cynaroides TaxID=273540 RepID=A0A9Q0KJT4_9MAGN|nr:hypothetical protein NE237_005001 [Protea cynaroides]